LFGSTEAELPIAELHHVFSRVILVKLAAALQFESIPGSQHLSLHHAGLGTTERGIGPVYRLDGSGKLDRFLSHVQPPCEVFLCRLNDRSLILLRPGLAPVDHGAGDQNKPEKRPA